MAPPRLAHFLALLSLGAATSALGDDGVVEINQARAAAGALNGSPVLDPPGYPVVISESGSYRLTGNLSGFGENVDAIVVSADDVLIDLNGFGLVGRGLPGSGVGIRVAQGRSRTVIRNGFVRGAGDIGVIAGADARVEAIVASGCGTEGIFAAPGGLVRGNEVVDNGSFGMVLGADTGYADNVLRGNTGPGVQGGVPLGVNLCDGRLCASPPRRRFYLTQAAHNGAAPVLGGACAPGFHFASLWELLDPTTLAYDTSLGHTRADSGHGPPSASTFVETLSTSATGWIRTGSVSNAASTTAGQANCNAWNANDAGSRGSVASLRPEWDQAPIRISPWITETRTCNSPIRVWCVQD